MEQRRMRQVSYDTEVGRVTAVYRVLDMRRPTWSLGSMKELELGCDVYFTKDRRWIAKNNGKELDMILSGGVFFVAAKPSKRLPRKRSALEPNSMSPAEVEQVTLTRVHAGFGVSGPGFHVKFPPKLLGLYPPSIGVQTNDMPSLHIDSDYCTTIVVPWHT